MDAEKARPREAEAHSLSSVLHEVSTSVRDLVQSEVDLVKAEIRESSHFLGRHAAQAAIFGALLAIGAIPFLAFLVIGLGQILGGNFWLSALIVTILCAAIGGSLAYRAYQKIRRTDLSLPKTRETMERSMEVVADKTQEGKNTTAEKITEIKDAAKRRAS